MYLHIAHRTIQTNMQLNNGTTKVHPQKYCTSNNHLSLLLNNIKTTIWNVETCRMCLRVTGFDPLPDSAGSPSTFDNDAFGVA